MRAFLVLPFLALLACGPSFQDAQKADTIEAYEQYLSQVDETDPFYFQAKVRLEELRLEKAEKEGTLEAFDAFLEMYPEGSGSQLREKAWKEREDAMYRWADEVGTKEAWEKFLQDYPETKRKRRIEAKRRIHMAENLHRIRLSNIHQERVNLAEDPEGPLDGWGFYADVTNLEDPPIEKLVLAIYYLDEDGKVLDRREWPVVAKVFPGYIPMPEIAYKPIKKGETRTWEWTTGDLPDGWAQKVRIVPVHIRLVGEEEEPGE